MLSADAADVEGAVGGTGTCSELAAKLYIFVPLFKVHDFLLMKLCEDVILHPRDQRI